METIVYLIRHAESIYVEGKDRTRGLSEQGHKDALRVKSILQDAIIDSFVSSPYERAILTVKPLADELHKEIIIIEELRERTIGDIGNSSFHEAKKRVYEDFEVAFAGGESSSEAQARGIQEMELLLEKYKDQTIAIGTHGDIMTLIINHYDPKYGYEFWQSTSMPDIYRLEFEDGKLSYVAREWVLEGNS
ncbi:histidine phosphatase family protein [Paenibacillus sp. sgz500992]|uniref:histidine phosphatase family protein n=1 Tax=Paenibacillus sp. sgz500992 TaxID=3242476 RepID=UPI0036D301F1